MNRSIPDATLPQGEWMSAYAATGLAVGRPLVIQNKSRTEILVYESTEKPGATQRDGESLAPGERARVAQGSVGVWLICRTGEGRAFIQEAAS